MSGNDKKKSKKTMWIILIIVVVIAVYFLNNKKKEHASSSRLSSMDLTDFNLTKCDVLNNTFNGGCFRQNLVGAPINGGQGAPKVFVMASSVVNMPTGDVNSTGNNNLFAREVVHRIFNSTKAPDRPVLSSVLDWFKHDMLRKMNPVFFTNINIIIYEVRYQVDNNIRYAYYMFIYNKTEKKLYMVADDDKIYGSYIPVDVFNGRKNITSGVSDGNRHRNFVIFSNPDIYPYFHFISGTTDKERYIDLNYTINNKYTGNKFQLILLENIEYTQKQYNDIQNMECNDLVTQINSKCKMTCTKN
jgi:hypothetical protein